MSQITYEQLRTVIDDLAAACKLSFQGTLTFECRKLSDRGGDGMIYVQRSGDIINAIHDRRPLQFKNAKELFNVLEILHRDQTLRTFPKGHSDFARACLSFAFYEGAERAMFVVKTGRTAIRFVATDECDSRAGDPYMLEIVVEGSFDTMDARSAQKLLAMKQTHPVLVKAA